MVLLLKEKYERISTFLAFVCRLKFLLFKEKTERTYEVDLLSIPRLGGKKMSKRLGGIKGCKYKTSLWHLNGFPDANNIGSTV